MITQSVFSLSIAVTMLFTSVLAAAPHRLACEDFLKPRTIANTSITTAKATPATETPRAPAHCDVVGRIHERTGQNGKLYAIGFHLRLPVEWNGRFFFQGGGGLDGNIGNAFGNIGTGATTNALALGYAVVSTDAGHTPDPAPGIGGALFGLDPQARVDYGYNAVDVVTRYGEGDRPAALRHRAKYSYFVGCSNGGRQGMIAAQRFPTLFNGIVAGDPGFNLPKAAVAEAWDSQSFALAATEMDANGQPYLPTSFGGVDLTLVGDAVLKQCDLADGLADGIVSNARACRFDPATLECQPGNYDACLSRAQVTALKRVFGGARDGSGKALYADWPWDPGIASPGWRIWKIGAPNPTHTNSAINLTLGASAIPYVFMTPPDTPSAGEIVRYVFGFDFNKDAPRILQTSGIYKESSMSFMAAASTDLGKFDRTGRKLLVYHGTADPVFSSNDTIDWYEALHRAAGGGDASRFARLFLIPGMNHCGGGPATDRFDQLTPLVQWVEQGVAPDAIVATANAMSPWPGRTRPLCAYPKQARYIGSGDVNDATSFVCK